MSVVEYSNVKDLSGYLSYKRMLRRADLDFNVGGALENFYMVTESKMYLGSAVTVEKKTLISTDTEYLQPLYNKLNSFACVRLLDGSVAKAFDLNIIVYDENFEGAQENRDIWDRLRTEHKFSNILKAQLWNHGGFIEDFYRYFDKLYELGFRLIKNDPVVDCVKTIHLNLNDVVLFIDIDYNVITSAIEMFDMLHDEVEGGDLDV